MGKTRSPLASPVGHMAGNHLSLEPDVVAPTEYAIGVLTRGIGTANQQATCVSVDVEGLGSRGGGCSGAWIG